MKQPTLRAGESPHDEPARLLIIDDNPDIHRDLQRILVPPRSATSARLDELQALLDGAPAERLANSAPVGPRYELEFARQGRDGVELARRAMAEGRPFALAFVDVRMPPGWDGLQTLQELWQCDGDLHAVLITAYSDYSWEDVQRRLGCDHRLLVLKKPFESVEVQQLALAVTEKWREARRVRRYTEELAAATAKARLANRAKSEFLATLSHEFRTPLNAVIGLSELVREELQRADFKGVDDELCQVISSAQCLLGLVDNALRYVQVDSDRDSVELSTFDLRELIAQTVESMTPKAAGNGNRIETTMPEVGIPLLSDRGRVRQILQSLLDNACKFTRDGTISVTLRLDERHHRLTLAVADTGIGIAPDQLDYVFELFTQGDSSPKRPFGGTGLGLALVRKLCSSLGGTISVES